jgi:hypothetical protein
MPAIPGATPPPIGTVKVLPAYVADLLVNRDERGVVGEQVVLEAELGDFLHPAAVFGQVVVVGQHLDAVPRPEVAERGVGRVGRELGHAHGLGKLALRAHTGDFD